MPGIKDLCEQMITAWNRGDIPAVTQLWAESPTHYTPEGRPVDSAYVIQLIEAGLRAFPDQHLEVDSMIAEGDRVAMRITSTATHKGEFLGVPATGRQVRWPMFWELRFAEGKVAELWDVTNYLPLLKTLGIVPDNAAPNDI